MQHDTTAPTIDELAAQVAKLRAQLDGHAKAVRVLCQLDEVNELPRPRLRVISGSARRRTARRGRLRVAE